MDVLKKEISDLDLKSSTYSVVRAKKVEESSLPESERSEIESELECPVCLEISRPPIYQCPEGHLICSACKPLLKSCCLCETKFTDPPIRCRFAEKLAARYFKDEDEKWGWIEARRDLMSSSQSSQTSDIFVTNLCKGSLKKTKKVWHNKLCHTI